MKISLVFPPSPIVSDPCCEGYSQRKVVCYELLMTAANLRKHGHEVLIIDAKAEDLSHRQVFERLSAFKPAMVALWTYTKFYLEDIKILKECKKLGCKTVLVMNPPTMLDYIMERNSFIDIAVHRYRQFVIPELADNLGKRGFEKTKGIMIKKGKRIADNGLPGIPDYSSLPMPAYDLTPMEKYNKGETIIFTSIGCPFQCNFCFWGRTKWLSRTPRQIIDEVRLLKEKYGYHRIGFSDQTFTLDRKRVKQVCEMMLKEKIGIKWECYSRVEGVDNEILALMKKAGCDRIFYGAEHVSNKVLERNNKMQKKEDIVNAIELSKKNGIRAVFPFIIGLPGETEETLQELYDFLMKNKPPYYYILTPIPWPGTPMYKEAKENNWLKVEEKPENFWIGDDYQEPIMIIPPFTKESLLEWQRKLSLYPRMSIGSVLFVLKDCYQRGGIPQVMRALEAGARIVFNKARSNKK